MEMHPSTMLISYYFLNLYIQTYNAMHCNMKLKKIFTNTSYSALLPQRQPKFTNPQAASPSGLHPWLYCTVVLVMANKMISSPDRLAWLYTSKLQINHLNLELVYIIHRLHIVQ